MRHPKPSPRVGVGVIVTAGDCVLLLKRRNVHGAETWSTPGGHLDYGEDPATCARREAREETGLEIGEPRFRAVTNDVFDDERRHYVTIWMEAAHLGGEPRLLAPYESSELAWFRWNALPTPLFLPLRHLLEGNSYGG